MYNFQSPGFQKEPDSPPPADPNRPPPAADPNKPDPNKPDPNKPDPNKPAAGTEQKTAEQLAEEKRIADEAEKTRLEEEEKKKKEAGDTGEDEFVPEEFFGEVNKITGLEVKVEYPADVDPLSAQGIALREKTIFEKGMEHYDGFLAKQDPRSYAYLLHRQAGGTDEDFFDKNNPGFVLPSIEDLKGNVDMQKQVYTADLRAKGLEDDAITTLVERAVKENKLLEKSEAAHKVMNSKEAARVKELQDAQDAEKAEYDKNVAGAVTAIDNVIKNNIRFILPPNVETAFKAFVMNNMSYENGNFFAVSRLTNENLTTVLESLFFQYQKGNLNEFVVREAKTKAAQSLRGRLKDANKRQSDGNDGTSTKPAFVALGDI